MYGKLLAFPEQVEDAAERAGAFPFTPPSGIECAIVCGMGGSAIGGDLARDYLRDFLRIPLEVIRDYRLPAYIGKKSLVIVSSYSGNTEETVSSMREALRVGAVVVALSTGGEVMRLAREHGVPHFELPSGFAPREALAYSIVPLLFLLRPLSGSVPLGEELAEARSLLRDLSPRLGTPDEVNEAYSLARELQGRFPVIYSAARHFGSVVTRWRSQLAENSEVLSSSHHLPEMHHNEIMGWRPGEDFLGRCHVIYLSDRGFHERVRRGWAHSSELIRKCAGGVTEVQSQGKGLLARVFSLIYKGDFVSLYHSFLRGIDPTPVARIEFIKDRLSREG
jgi:glucose/mannose-6-phosphate isomerase